MSRSFLSLTFTLAAAALILAGAVATAVSAQPASDAPPAAAPKPKRYPEAEEAVKLLLNQRDYAGALKKLEEASRKYPEIPSAHVLMYQILAQLSQPHARLELDEAIKANPKDPEPYVILGSIALQERRVAEAKSHFDRAKQLLATCMNAERKGTIMLQISSSMAREAEQHKDWKEAEIHLREMLKTAPEDVVTHRRLGHSLFAQGRASEAYIILKKAKAMDRKNAKKHGTREGLPALEFTVGQAWDLFEGSKSTKEDSEECFRAAIKAAPQDLPTRQVVALWALQECKIVFAKEQAEAALRIEASDSEKFGKSTVGHTLRGLVALWEKDWPAAELHFQAIIDRSPRDFVARNNLALALIEQDDQAKRRRALEYAEANLRENPKNPDALSTVGWVYYRRNEFDLATRVADQLLKMTGGRMEPDMATYAAHILYYQQKRREATEILETILIAERPFAMRPEAEHLYKKIKGTKKP